MHDWLIKWLIIIFGLIVVDIFCQKHSNIQLTKIASTTPKQWIQQNNIWIRNEQAASVTNPLRQNADQRQQFLNNKNLNSSTQNRSPSLTLQNSTPTSQQKNPSDVKQASQIKSTPITPSNGIGTTPKPFLTFSSLFGLKSSTVSPLSSSLSSVSSQPPNNKIGFTSAGDRDQNNLEFNTDNNQTITILDDDATDDELREFFDSLFKKDRNNGMKYVTLNLQGTTTARSSRDNAPLPLMTIKKEAYGILPVQKLIALHNNYFLNVEENEENSAQERIEENSFLDTILATPIMEFARRFLIIKGKIGKDPKEFKNLLRQIWFNMYSRGKGRIGSSGFEHVFLAEVKNNQISGLHNWLYFNDEELRGHANYLGYMKKLDLGDKGVVLKYHFTFNNIDKPVGSMFIGTSPELEIALYSVCFVLRPDKICPIKVNNNKFIIRTYSFRYRGKNMIGSAFPEI